MSKGYWIAHNDVQDMEVYKTYLAGAAEPFARFGATFLARGGAYTAPEGVVPSRNIVIEFPSYQAALDCYNCPEYQAASVFRKQSSTGQIIIMDGVA